MSNPNKISIKIETTLNAPINKTWTTWNLPEHITQWYFASNDWHCPRAENDLRVGGKFLIRMEAKDGSFGFDFEGVYLTVKNNELIEYILADERKVRIEFTGNDTTSTVVETFDAENENPVEMQQLGWQAILNNFKSYTESI